MLHESIFSTRFEINRDNDGWISFEANDGKQIPGFGTKRIAKLSGDTRFVFTIGETRKGKRNDLSRSIDEVIARHGLPVIEESTTNGTLRNQKIYKGFDLRLCTTQKLDQILNEVSHLIAHCG